MTLSDAMHGNGVRQAIGKVDARGWPRIITVASGVIAAVAEGAREAQQLPHVRCIDDRGLTQSALPLKARVLEAQRGGEGRTSRRVLLPQPLIANCR